MHTYSKKFKNTSKAEKINYLLSFGKYPYGTIAKMAKTSTSYVSEVMNSKEGSTARQSGWQPTRRQKRQKRNKQNFYRGE